MSSPHNMHILTCKLRSRSMPVVEDVRTRVSANIEVDERQYGSVAEADPRTCRARADGAYMHDGS